MRWLAALLAGLATIASTQSLPEEEVDSEQSRKVLGSSVVTSVSVIMDHGNGTKTYIGDTSDGTVGSPGDLLAPDRYEFYTFDESGDLVKRLMTLDQIQGLIAGGDTDGMEGDASAPTYYHEVLPDVEPSDLQGVHKVVANVQNVLKSELEATKNKLPMTKPLSVLSVPDAASSWSILLPGVLGGPLEDNRAPESEPTERQPPAMTTTIATTTTVEETTQRETTENPTVIHYLPIKNIPPPPKRNSSVHLPMTITTVSATTMTSLSDLSTIPVASDTKPIATETTMESSTTDSTQSVPPSSTFATSPETEAVMEEMAASLSSVLSQVVEDANVSNPLDSNYIPVGLSPQNFITAGAESRPQSTKVQVSSTTPLSFTTHSQPLHMENKISTAKPSTVSKENNKEKPQVKVTTAQQQTVKLTSPSAPSTTERINNLTSLEYSNGAVSDYQMISEALAAQGIAESSLKIETKIANESLITTESTKSKYPTDSTSEVFPPLSELLKLTSAHNTFATMKPVSSTKPRPSTSRPMPTTDNATKTTSLATKYNTTKSSTKTPTTKPNTPNSQPKPLMTKAPTTTKQQPTSNSHSSTYSSTPAATQIETTTLVDKKTTTKANTTAAATKGKPVMKKPISKPTATTVLPKIKNESVAQMKENEKMTSKQEERNYTLISSTATTAGEIKNQITKLNITKAPSETVIQSTTDQIASTAEKSDSTTFNYNSKINNSDILPNYIASSSNRESVSTNPTTENTPDLTTLNLESEGEMLQEGISAVTSILLQENNMQPVPANKFTGLNSKPVMGELKHASQINSDEMESTTETKDIYSTTLDSTTDSVSNSPEGTTNENSSTEKELKLQTDTNITDNDTTTTDYQYTTEAETTINTEQSLKTIKDSGTTPFNASAIEFTTSIYEGTTNMQNENIVPAEKKTADYELESGGQSTQLKESKISPETNSKGAGTGSNLIDNQVKPNLNLNKTVHNSSTYETLKQPSLNFVGNSTKLQIKNNSTHDEHKENLPTKSNSTNNHNSTVVWPGLKRPGDQPSSSPVELHPAPHESLGLEASTSLLGDDVRRFADLCNELSFRMWTSITGKGTISARSLVLSPFAVTSLLAMVFLGARGPTSGQMNDVLRLDDMVTFNPHQVLKNVTESVLNSKNYGVATAAFVRELYSDKAKGKILDFYKERAQQYYDGHVEEINFGAIGDILRRRTNLLIKRQTLGRVPEYLRGSSLSLRPPLAAFSANIFQTDCEQASVVGRDGEMYFVVRPSTRQRRLVPVPAAVWRSGFLAGYEPGLDATAVCLGAESVVSTLFVLPGQQGQVAPGDGLARLEQRLIETSYRRGGWSRLLRSLLARPGLELQVPRFSHRSVLNVTGSLQRMGLKDLFNAGRADLRGLNGFSNDLHLSDMVQINTFSTCAEDTIGARHHTETYPVSPQRMGREDPERYPAERTSDLSHIPLALRPRQARLPENPRLRFDRPFLYMVRHNPTGMILHMGRFNPRLLP